MRYINGLCEGETIRNIYLCKGKRSAETRNGKPYDNLLLQDKTGILDGKVWDPNSQGIADYDEKDFIEVYGDVISYNGNLQLNIKQIRRAEEGEYNPADYMPTTDCRLPAASLFCQKRDSDTEMRHGYEIYRSMIRSARKLISHYHRQPGSSG